MRKTLFVLMFLGVAAALAGGMVWWRWSASTSSNADAAAVFASASADAGAAVPEGSVAYQNAQYKFALAYPKELSVSEHAEAAGSHTASFESASGDKGFQIFVLPYAGAQIAASRIQEDTHGTALGTPQEVVLPSGTHALLFESRDPLLGEMREVWFLHGGYLYEVTAYMGLDEWLAGIMSTWRFTE